MLKVILSHDVDRIRKSYQYITHPIKALKRGDFRNFISHIFAVFRQKRPYWGFDEILAIETKYDVKSTFFFLHETIKISPLKSKSWLLSSGRYKFTNEKIVRIIKFLDENGWEVGLHGSYNSYKDKELLKKEKELLDKILGKSVEGIRQHWLNLNDSTWAIQKEVGLKYDSSWGSSKDIGFRENRYYPFKPINDDDFVVFPMAIMDTPFMVNPNRWELFEKCVQIVDEKDTYLVINFHTNNFDKIDFPGYKDAYVEMIERLKKKNAIFLTMNGAFNEIEKTRIED